MSNPLLHPDLPQLARKLIADGPHKTEKARPRVRCIFGGDWLLDTTSASHVWEHPYFPQIYILTSAIKSDLVTKETPVDEEKSAFTARLKNTRKETDRVLVFEKGQLAGLTRLEFGAMGTLSFHPTAPLNGSTMTHLYMTKEEKAHFGTFHQRVV